MTDIEQIKREASEYVFKINTPSHSRSDFAIYLHQYIDYLHSRGYFGGVPDGYVLVQIDDHYKRIIHDHTKGEMK